MPEAKTYNWQKIKNKIIVLVIVAVAVYFVLTIVSDWQATISALESFNYAWLPVIFGLAFLNYLTRFVRWSYYLKRLKIKIPRKSSFIVFLAGLGLSITPGKFGEVIKSYLLKQKHKTPISKSLPVVVAERLTDLIAVLILTLLGVFTFPVAQKPLLWISGIIIVILVILLIPPLARKIIKLLEKLPVFSKFGHKIHETYDVMYDLIKAKPLIIGTVIGTLAWFWEALAFFLVILIFGQSISLLNAVFIYSLATMLGAVVMLPGGLGVTEGSLTGLSVLVNIPKGVAAAATLIIRLATLWFAVALGLIIMSIYRKDYE